jgi:secernin
MCDTFVALPDTSLGGEMIFAKNSDRPQGEIQDVIACPAQDYPDNTLLQCTYMQIPQIEHSYATILSKPRWMWGAEMGANEHGVVIGNEAVWTTQAYNDSGLLGMDLLRLGLERGATAEKALQIIVALLEEHGQGGNCAEHFSMNYHNSFLIADKNEAWVLETADKVWVAERISHGTRSISNSLSIRNKGDHRHPELDRAMQADALTDFDFAQVFSMDDIESSPSPYSREGRVRELCQQHAQQFNFDTAKAILQDHETGICMHGEFESRGSQISILSEQSCQHWFIEGPFPCEEEYRQKTFLN